MIVGRAGRGRAECAVRQRAGGRLPRVLGAYHGAGRRCSGTAVGRSVVGAGAAADPFGRAGGQAGRVRTGPGRRRRLARGGAGPAAADRGGRPRRAGRLRPRVRPGPGDRGPAGRAAGGQPAQRRADVPPRRAAHPEPGRPADLAHRQAGEPRRPSRTGCASCTGSTTSPAACAAARAAWSCSPARPRPTSTWRRSPLDDVVRLGLAEIEDYTRVDIDVPDAACGSPRPSSTTWCCCWPS